MPGDEILQWELMINWKEVPEADVRIGERDGRNVMLLTDCSEEIELAHWREGAPGAQGRPASIVDTLGLYRRSSNAS